MAWHKFHGGQEHDWIGFSLFASQRWVGISQRRTGWLVNWFRKVRADGMVRVADMQAVLGRLSFAFSVLPTLRPFLGPVYAWVGAMQSRHVMPLPKALSLIFSFLEKALVDGYRVCEVPRATATTAEYFRTDARAEGSEMWIGGWCTADSKHPKQCRWFAEKLDHTKAAVFYMAGQSYRSIGALEMLASLVALLLFRPDQERKGSVRGVVNVCSAGTDNKGNTYVLARWLTTSFPLIAVLMEFSLVLADFGLDMQLHWTPRLQNVLADSLTNGDFKDFDPSKRLRFSFESYESKIMAAMLDQGAHLYAEIAEHKARKEERAAKTRRKSDSLRERDPWGTWGRSSFPVTRAEGGI